MTDSLDPEIRERLTRLETGFTHGSRQLEDMRAVLARLDQAFRQAHGARWAILVMASLGGFIAGKAGVIAGWMGIVPR